MLEVLYLPVLVVLLSPLACNVIHAHTRDVPATNKIFPDKQCYTGEVACDCTVAYRMRTCAFAGATHVTPRCAPSATSR